MPGTASAWTLATTALPRAPAPRQHRGPLLSGAISTTAPKVHIGDTAMRPPARGRRTRPPWMPCQQGQHLLPQGSSCTALTLSPATDGNTLSKIPHGLTIQKQQEGDMGTFWNVLEGRHQAGRGSGTDSLRLCGRLRLAAFHPPRGTPHGREGPAGGQTALRGRWGPACLSHDNWTQARTWTQRAALRSLNQMCLPAINRDQRILV